MLILRQSTAIDIRMGPFVDATDGVTPETGITLGAADQAEALKENGAATAAMAGTFAAVSGCDGWYDYTASTTDTNTVGEIVFVVQDASVCLPVLVRAMVVEEAVYDAYYDAGSDGIPSGVALASALTTVDTVVDGIQTDLSNGTDGLGAIKTAVDAIPTTAMRGTDNAATEAKQDIIDTNIDQIEAAVITNAAGVDVAADIIALKAETALIVADTNELQGDNVPGLISTLDAVVDTVKVDTAAIKVETDKLTFTVANELDTNIKSINDVTLVGDGSGTPFNV